MGRGAKNSSIPNILGMEEKEIIALENAIVIFFQSYDKKPSHISNIAWLTETLNMALTMTSSAEIAHSTEKLIGYIRQFESNLKSLNEAIKHGQTKEEWFREQSQKAAVGMNVNDYGNKLTKIHEALLEGNYSCIQKTAIRNKYSAPFNQQSAERSDWNGYNTRELALQIGKETNFAGIKAATLAAIQLSQNSSAQKNRNMVFTADINADDIEVILAGVWRYVLMSNRITTNLSTAILANIACVGGQIIRNLLSFANGKIDGGKALTDSATAMTAAVYGLCWNDETMSSELLLLPQLTAVTGYVVGSVMSCVVNVRLFVAADEMADIGVVIVRSGFNV